MSILIKGMDMPISCEKCPLCCDYLYCIIDESLRMFLYNRHPNCPLVEIPTPHGRLIDADLLKDMIRDSVPAYGIGVKIPTYGDMDIMDKIGFMPTILEPET